MRTSLVLLALGFALASLALAQPPGCLENAIGQSLCPRNPAGTAVIDGFGEVVCAAGQCVQERHDTEWKCARAPGGWARLGSDGPECEGGCVAPSERECESQ